MLEWAGPVFSINLAGYGKTHRILKPLLLSKSVFSSLRLLKKHKPDAVLAMGGYASAGPVLAASLLRIPTVIHEGNAVPGRTFRFLSRFASITAVNFSDTVESIHRASEITGFPLRGALVAASQKEPGESLPGKPAILILGGSQGAEYLNKAAPAMAQVLKARGGSFSIIHVAGETGKDSAAAEYSRLGIDAEVHGFVNEMNLLYTRTSMALSRAGASALAELALFGIPSLLIPFPFASDNHQKANAGYYCSRGGAVALEQASCTPEKAADFFESLIKDRDLYRRMGRAMLSCAEKDAAARLARLVEKAGGYTKNAYI